MKEKKAFFHMVSRIVIPVALQSMLQASFSIVDQIMIGQLGSVSIAGVGLAGKFAGIFSVIVSAIGAVAGIMISQYIGQDKTQKVKKSFLNNLLAAAGLAIVFTILCGLFPEAIMGLYTRDAATRQEAAGYLFLMAATFLPMAGATILSTLLRCMEKASLPLFASISAAVLNTGLNYIFIFGKLGIAPMGSRGAALATVISQLANFLIIFALLCRELKLKDQKRFLEKKDSAGEAFDWKQYGTMLLPVLTCEFMWSLGENIYTGIYGHLGTEACAAMTLLNPIQGLMIGALCGLSQAAGVIIGKMLGNKEYEEAYRAAKKLLWYGFCGAFMLSGLLLLVGSFYLDLYQVEEEVKQMAGWLLAAYAVIAPVKVENMILSGGVIRSGGRTKYVMWIDLIGTWLFGVPMGLFAAFVCHLSIPWVYFMLSLEEAVRLGISIRVFQKKVWMQSLE